MHSSDLIWLHIHINELRDVPHIDSPRFQAAGNSKGAYEFGVDCVGETHLKAPNKDFKG